MNRLSAGPRLRVTALGVSTILLLAACGNNSNNQASNANSTSVTVWSAWGGQELKAFQDVLKPFEQQTGIQVKLTTVRDTSQLAVNVDAGTTLPDIAPGPTIDKLQSWVSKGVMKPLESFLDMSAYKANTYTAVTTPPSGNTDLYLGIVNGKHYEEMVKTQVKGLMWYNPKVFPSCCGGQIPKTMDDLFAIKPPGGTKLFCAGLESGAASGWPASDQLDNIIMRQAGDQVYTQWIQGKVKFTDPKIKEGWQTYLKEVAPNNVYGGVNTVLSTNFGNAGTPLFSNPPGCLFLEQATFITNFFTQNNASLKASTDYDFFPHPSINPQYDGNVNGFYDNFVMYNDTPAARRLMQYMVTPQAQQIWANGGGTLASNKNMNYSDPIFKRAATVAQGAKNLLVTAGDFMPADMQSAFWKGLLDATKNPGSLDSVLQRLDQVQSAAYSG